jgi:hypothetical protein
LVEGSIAKSKSGKAKVDAVAESVRAITSESERVRVLVTEVHAGSREQGRGVQQITETTADAEGHGKQCGERKAERGGGGGPERPISRTLECGGIAERSGVRIEGKG